MSPICAVAEVIALLCYLVAAVCYPLRLLRPDVDLTRLGRAGWLVGAGLQAFGLIGHAWGGSDGLIIGRYANAVFVLVLFLLAGAELQRRRIDRPAVGAFVAPVVFLLVLTSVFRPQIPVPAAPSPWFAVHILLALLGYACFGIAAAMAAAYLLDDALLKRKQISRLKLLPSLETADNAAHMAVAVGLPLFSLGLLVGAANLLYFGSPFDVKIGLAVACWLVYAAYLYLRGTARLRGTRVQLLVLLGFALAVANLLLARHAEAVYNPHPIANAARVG